MARKSTPATRRVGQQKEIQRVRRKYKVNVSKPKKFVAGEEAHVEQMVVVLKIAGYSNVQAAKIVGVGRNQVAEILKRPRVLEMLTSLRLSLPQAALELLQGYMIEAVQAIVDVMRVSNDDKYVLQAAGEILDRAGIPKASRQERHNVNEERTTFTDEGVIDRLRDAPPAVQEKAAQMIEAFEELLAEYADVEAVEDDGENS